MQVLQMDFSISSKRRNQMIDVTGQIQSAVKESGIKNGTVTIYCPHTTAGITINENADPSVQKDILFVLSKLIVHQDPNYTHIEGNADSHCKSSIVGCSEHLLIRNGGISLGTWQGIFFCEFDGPRSRKVFLQISGQ